MLPNVTGNHPAGATVAHRAGLTVIGGGDEHGWMQLLQLVHRARLRLLRLLQVAGDGGPSLTADSGLPLLRARLVSLRGRPAPSAGSCRPPTPRHCSAVAGP